MGKKGLYLFGHGLSLPSTGMDAESSPTQCAAICNSRLNGCWGFAYLGPRSRKGGKGTLPAQCFYYTADGIEGEVRAEGWLLYVQRSEPTQQRLPGITSRVAACPNPSSDTFVFVDQGKPDDGRYLIEWVDIENCGVSEAQFTACAAACAAACLDIVECAGYAFRKENAEKHCFLSHDTSPDLVTSSAFTSSFTFYRRVQPASCSPALCNTFETPVLDGTVARQYAMTYYHIPGMTSAACKARCVGNPRCLACAFHDVYLLCALSQESKETALSTVSLFQRKHEFYTREVGCTAVTTTTTKTTLVNCQGFCAQHLGEIPNVFPPSTWVESCTYVGCGGCNECLTSGAADQCAGFCASHTDERTGTDTLWSERCTFPACAGCTDCALPRCESWCSLQSTPWSTQCTMPACAACIECAPPTTPCSNGWLYNFKDNVQSGKFGKNTANRLSSDKATSLEACALDCLALAQCVAFSYHLTFKHCFLMAVPGNLQTAATSIESDNWRHYIQRATGCRPTTTATTTTITTTRPTECEAGILDTYDLPYPNERGVDTGLAIASIITTAPVYCADACHTSSQCRAFAFAAGSGTCEFYKFSSVMQGPVVETGWDWYRRLDACQTSTPINNAAGRKRKNTKSWRRRGVVLSGSVTLGPSPASARETNLLPM